MKTYVPVTPGGSVLMHLEAKSEKQAWNNLLKDVRHMPYRSVKDLQERGYTVEEFIRGK